MKSEEPQPPVAVVPNNVPKCISHRWKGAMIGLSIMLLLMIAALMAIPYGIRIRNSKAEHGSIYEGKYRRQYINNEDEITIHKSGQITIKGILQRDSLSVEWKTENEGILKFRGHDNETSLKPFELLSNPARLHLWRNMNERSNYLSKSNPLPHEGPSVWLKVT